MTSSNYIKDDNRPKTPTEDDCCGNGCSPCIFDIHKKLLEEWNNKKLNQSSLSLIKNSLSPLKYNRFIVKDIAKASEDCVFIQLNCGLGILILSVINLSDNPALEICQYLM